jgi:hypothetical protein
MEARWSLWLYWCGNQLCIKIHLNNTDGDSDKVFAGFKITLGKRKLEFGDNKNSLNHQGSDLELLHMLINLYCYIDR